MFLIPCVYVCSGCTVDSESIDWISQFGTGRKKKSGIFSFIKAAYLRRSERKVRDINDLDASNSIRRYNKAFGIDSDNPGAAVRRIRLPVDDSSLRDVIDFTPSDSGNRPAVETEYSYAVTAPSAVPTSSMADTMPTDPFPFEAVEEEEQEDPYTEYIREKYGGTETAAEKKESYEFPDYETEMEEATSEVTDVWDDVSEFPDAEPEMVQTSIDDPTFDVPDAPVSAEPVISRQDFLEVQFDEQPQEDVASEIAEAAAEAEALRSYVDSIPADAETEASAPIQFIEAPEEYEALEAPVEFPALEAPVETETVPVIEATEEVPMLAASEPVAAVCAPAEVRYIAAPAEEPVTEAPVAEGTVSEAAEDVIDEDIEAYIYSMQDAEPVAEQPVAAEETIPVEDDMFYELMELQDAMDQTVLPEISAAEPVIEAPAEVPAEAEPVVIIPVIEEQAEEPVAEVPAEDGMVFDLAGLIDSYEPEVHSGTVQMPVAEAPVENDMVFDIAGLVDSYEPEAPAEVTAEPETVEIPIIQLPVYEQPAEAPAVEEAPVAEDMSEEYDLFDDFMEMQDAMDHDAPAEVQAEEPVTEIPAEEPVTEVPVAEEIPAAEPVWVPEAPVAAEEPVFEEPAVETPLPSVDDMHIGMPLMGLPSSRISFRFGVMPLPVRSSGIRFSFGTMRE